MKISSIRTKIVIWAGACLLVVAAALTAYAAISSSTTSMESARQQAISTSESEAASVESQLNDTMATVRTFALVLSATKASEQPVPLKREQIDRLVRRILASSPSFVSTYTGWEPLTFDGMDGNYAKTTGHDETGRFMSYWVRGADDKLERQILTNFDAPWYLCPKESSQECITAPNPYTTGNVNGLMTALVVPIIAEGQFYGVAGADVRLDSLQTLADAMNLYDGAAVMVLISNNGTLVGVTGHPELVGKPMSDYYSNAAQLLPFIKDGKEYIDVLDDTLKVFVPIHVGHTTSPWSVNINIPMSAIMAESHAVSLRLIGIGIGLAILALGFLWLAARQIANPITAMVQAAHLLAQGNVQQTVTVSSADEIGKMSVAFNETTVYMQTMAHTAERLAEGDLSVEITPRSSADLLGLAFQRMIASWRTLVSQLTENAVQLRSASEELASTSEQAGQATSQVTSTIQQVAQSTASQAAMAGQASAAVDGMSRQVEGFVQGIGEQAHSIQDAHNSVKSLEETLTLSTQATRIGADMAQQTATAAKAGVVTVDRAVQGMQAIQQAANIVAQRVREMGQRSEEIGKIVSTIQDIASQTDLLALNAAIEAARAGDQGRGFAVVADEVRKLAERSATSSREIAELVRAVQKGTTEAVKATDEAVSSVSTGMKDAAQAGQALHQILAAAEQNAKATVDIQTAGRKIEQLASRVAGALDSVSRIGEGNVEATGEMASRIGEVAGAAESVAAAAEENSASVEEVSATAEELTAQIEEVSAAAQELSRLAGSLQNAVGQFHLDAVVEAEAPEEELPQGAGLTRT